MILEFTVKNFLSFKKEQKLSFEATSDTTLEDYYCVRIDEKTRILKVGIVFGNNASGKTNLIKALEFLREKILHPRNRDEGTDFIPFLFSDKTKTEPGLFSLTFYINKTKYIYKLLLDEQKVLEEQLHYYPSTQPALLYSRIALSNGSLKITLGSRIKSKAMNGAILQGNTLKNMTVISALSKSNLDIPELEKVYAWFNSTMMPIITPKTDLEYWTVRKAKQSDKCRSFLKNLLLNADFQVSDVVIKREDIKISDKMKTALENSDIPEEARNEFLKNEKMPVTKLNFSHGINTGNNDLDRELPLELESSGTLRYFALGGPLNEALNRNVFLAIDEIENSLHTDLVLHFLWLFLENSERSQLLISTHNLLFLYEKENIRKDVIWFAEKGKDGSSSIYSLSDFKIRKELSFFNAYIAGKFGAKPLLGNKILNTKDGTKN